MVRRSILLLLAFLAGCAERTAPPAPIELHTHAGAPVLSEPVPIVHPDRITVASADTLYGLSRRYGLPIRAIIDANNLQPPYRLVAGSSLILPQVRTHLVRPGDTLMSVARTSGVDISTLAATNHLTPPFVIRTGETLILPARVETASAAPPPQRVAAAPLAPPAAEPPLAAAQKPANAPSPPQPQAKPTPPPETALDEPDLPPPEPPRQDKTVPVPPPEPPQDKTASLPPPETPLKPTSVFIWPVHGHVLASFGESAQGTHNDGIDIAAPEGTPVLAAAAGEVAYAGNELKGYGNLILVKHDNGFVTAYAHNASLLVKRGDRVARGQPIAKVGATGAVDQPQLHFEIRRGTRALDPSDYLPAQAATASR
ncbi:MAG TPA: LysM peptidoglycan-binding domain-containing M23 family metallopeptidase [Stellaceae bacterium]|nr:LysM peptidoglycan-binding domain-containing M23 family metallopeptidase [Stellaceae bacterium]